MRLFKGSKLTKASPKHIFFSGLAKRGRGGGGWIGGCEHGGERRGVEGKGGEGRLQEKVMSHYG